MSYVSLLVKSSRKALQWRWLLLWVLAQALPALLVCLPLWAAMAEQLDHSLRSARLVGGFDAGVYLEALMSLAHYRYSPASALSGMLVFALTSPWLAGVTMTIANAPGRIGWRVLLHGGLREYWRMTRLLLWALIPLGLAVAAGALAVHLAQRYGLKTPSADAAERAMHAAELLAALSFVLAHATLDATCAQLVLERERRSVVRAWLRATLRLLRRPACLPMYLLLTAAGLTLSALFIWLRILTPAVGAFGMTAAFVLAQMLVLALGWMRCARLCALVGAGQSSL